ncbi:hypothetical protein BGZ73_007119 [Actinomortierella ambigua]|nr:hypothetical protein BGZ73_007119 [Actinomortierella ambigua]
MSAPSSTGGLSAHTTNSGSCSTTTTAVASAAASMSSLMLPPSDHGVSDLTIPEEEEEEDYATGHDDLSSYGAHSSKADEEEEERNEHHHPHDTTSSRQSSMSAATIAKRAVDDSENVHRSSSKIKRGARKIKKWLTTSKSRPQDLDKASAMAMQVTPPPLKGRNMSISSSSYSTASSSSSYSSSPLLAVGDEKIHPFQKHRRPSSQRDHDTAIPPLELNMPSKDQRRERKALSIVRPQTTNDLSDAHANVPFPVLMPEPRLRHTRSASLQTRNAATLYKGGNNGGTPRRHSSQTLRSPSTTLPTHPSSRRSLDQASEEQLWRSLQRIAHFNQRFRQKMPGPDQPCPPIRARSSSLPRSFSPALTPLDRLPASVSTYPAGGETEATVDENAAMLSLDEHRGRYCPKARSPLGHDAAVAATTTAMAASQADGASAAAVQFEQEYLQHLEQQAEQAQAEQEMKQKRQSVWVDYVDLELPESLPPSRSVVASAAARSRSTTPPSSPPPTPTTGWRGPMYWNAEGATSLQSIPSMPSSSPAHSRRNSIVSFYEDSVADESKAYQASSDDEESDDMDSSEEYDEEDEDDEEAVELHAPYPSFMTKWDMEIASEFASESKMLADDWIHPHAEDDDDDRDEEGHQEQEHDENDNRPQPPAHLRNHTNQSYLSLSSTRRSSTVAESLMSASDTMSVSGAATARLTGFLQYKTMMPNPSNMAIGKRFFWAVEAPMLPKPELTSTNTDTNTDINTKIDNTNA